MADSSQTLAVTIQTTVVGSDGVTALTQNIQGLEDASARPLSDPTKQLDQGAKAAAADVDGLAQEVGKLDDAASHPLHDPTGPLAQGANAAAGSVDALAQGVGQLDDVASKPMRDPTGALSQGANAAADSVDALAQGVGQLDDVASKPLHDPTRALSQGANAAADSLGVLGGQLGEVDAASGKSADAVADFNAALKTLGVQPVKNVEEEVQRLNQAFDQLKTSGMASAEQIGVAEENLKAKIADVTGETAKAKEKTDAFDAALKSLGVQPIQNIEEEIARLNRDFDLMKNSGMASAEEIAQAQTNLKAKIAELNGEVPKATGAFGGMAESMGNTIKMAAGFVAFSAVFEIFNKVSESIKGVITTAGDFELLRVQLDAVEGSSRRGGDALEWIKQKAADMPFTVQQVTETFIQMRNAGMEPMKGAFEAIGEQVAKLGGKNETLQRITLALTQAWTKMKLEGQDIMQLNEAGVPVWDLLAKATGKNVSELQNLSQKGLLGRDVMEKLIETMGKMASGSLQGAMQTWTGLTSNLSDQWSFLLNKIGESGALDFAKQKVQGLLDLFAGATATGSIKTFAQGVSDALVGMGETLVNGLKIATKFVTDFSSTFDFTAVKSSLTTLGNLASTVFDGLSNVGKEAGAAIQITMGTLALAFNLGAAAIAKGSAAVADFISWMERLRATATGDNAMLEMSVKQKQAADAMRQSGQQMQDDASKSMDVIASGWGKLADTVTGTGQIVSTANAAIAQSTQQAAAAHKDYANVIGETGAAQLLYIQHLQDLKKDLDEGKITQAQYEQAVKDTNAALAAAPDKIKAATDSTAKAAQASAEAGVQEAEHVKQMEAAKKAYENLKQEQEAISQAVKDGVAPAQSLNDAVNKLTTANSTYQQRLQEVLKDQENNKSLMEKEAAVARDSIQTDINLANSKTAVAKVLGLTAVAHNEAAEATRLEIVQAEADAAAAQKSATAAQEIADRKEELAKAAGNSNEALNQAAAVADLDAKASAVAAQQARDYAAAMRELSDATIANNAVSQEKQAHNNAVASQNHENAEKQAADAKKAQEALNAIDDSAAGIESMVATTQAEAYGLSQAMGDAYRETIRTASTLDQVIDRSGRFYQIILDANAQIKANTDAQNALTDAMSSGVNVAARMQAALVAMSASTSNIKDGMRLLDDQHLTGLQSAIAAARAQMKGLEDDAKSMYASLQDEMYQLEGNAKASENLQYQQKMIDMQAKLDAAKKAGSDAAANQWQQAMDLETQIHNKKLQNIADQQAASQAQAQASAASSASQPTASAPVATTPSAAPAPGAPAASAPSESINNGQVEVAATPASGASTDTAAAASLTTSAPSESINTPTATPTPGAPVNTVAAPQPPVAAPTLAPQASSNTFYVVLQSGSAQTTLTGTDVAALQNVLQQAAASQPQPQTQLATNPNPAGPTTGSTGTAGTVQPQDYYDINQLVNTINNQRKTAL